MAGQVDEMTAASQYTQGHPIPRFALKENAVIQIVQKDKIKEGHEKTQNQSPHQEKLPPNEFYTLRNPSAEVGGNKVKIFFLQNEL
jgi:hypothetical protein